MERTRSNIHFQPLLWSVLCFNDFSVQNLFFFFYQISAFRAILQKNIFRGNTLFSTEIFIFLEFNKNLFCSSAVKPTYLTQIQHFHVNSKPISLKISQFSSVARTYTDWKLLFRSESIWQERFTNKERKNSYRLFSSKRKYLLCFH